MGLAFIYKNQSSCLNINISDPKDKLWKKEFHIFHMCVYFIISAPYTQSLKTQVRNLRPFFTCSKTEQTNQILNNFGPANRF